MSLHLELHSLLPSFLLVFFLLLILPLQRRAAAGAQPEDHGKFVLFRNQRGCHYFTTILPPKRYLLVKDFEPMLSQENIQFPIMQCRRN